MFKRVIDAFLGKQAEEPVRQTIFGICPPFPSASTHEELLRNLEYIESQLQTNGIRHNETGANLWDNTLNWYQVYVRAAKTVDSDDAAPAISEAALSLLPQLNPYADRAYDEDNLKDLQDLFEASEKVVKPATIRLGDAIVTADPDVRDERGVLVSETLQGLKDSYQRASIQPFRGRLTLLYALNSIRAILQHFSEYCHVSLSLSGQILLHLALVRTQLSSPQHGEHDTFLAQLARIGSKIRPLIRLCFWGPCFALHPIYALLKAPLFVCKQLLGLLLVWLCTCQVIAHLKDDLPACTSNRKRREQSEKASARIA